MTGSAGGDAQPDIPDEWAELVANEMRRHKYDRSCDDGCDHEHECARAVIAKVRPLIAGEAVAAERARIREEVLRLELDDYVALMVNQEKVLDIVNGDPS